MIKQHGATGSDNFVSALTTDECTTFVNHFRSLIRLAGGSDITAQVYIYATRSTRSGSEEREGVTLHYLRPVISTVIEKGIARCETRCAACMLGFVAYVRVATMRSVGR
jgi:hypothetical protein